MGRPAKYASEQERKAADAERKRRARANGETPPDKPLPPPTPPPPPTSLDAYVNEALQCAELHHSQASPQATMSTKSLAETLERAENYARWRYAGVVSGEINGL